MSIILLTTITATQNEVALWRLVIIECAGDIFVATIE